MNNHVYLMDNESIRQLGEELWRRRRAKHLLLEQVQKQSGIPAKVIEGLELGRYLQYGYARKLLKFYGVNMKIVLE